MKVWILQTGEPLHIDKSDVRPMRAINLTDRLIERGHDVTLWSSDFNHSTKVHRFATGKEINISDQFSIRLIKSKGYKSHIGIGRLLDHIQLGINLNGMIKRHSSPDVVFIGYPPIEPAWVMSKWLRRRGVPFLLDIKDAWPQVLIEAFPKKIRFIARIGFFPYQIMMKDTFSSADGLSSISESFLKNSLQAVHRKKSEFDFVAPLTSPDPTWNESANKNAEKFWDGIGVRNKYSKRVYFVGTLNHVFDFRPAIYAARNSDIEFVIAGDGPQRQELINLAKNLPNFILPGWISSTQATVLAERSHLSLAPTKTRSDFEDSIPNKFIDAFRLGKPILSSLGGISEKLLTDKNVGVTFVPSIEDDLLLKLSELFQNRDRIFEMSQAARNLYLDEFEFAKVYDSIVTKLELLARSKNPLK
jgi:glycosyltransferase involved in cell wall biosynthesis